VGASGPRRGHGEDSIYFDRANNCYVGAVSLGHKAGKRVRRKITGRTKTEVKAKLRQLRHELDSGVRSSATYTVGNALDDWLASGLSGRSGRTVELYRDTVKPLREQETSKKPWMRWPDGSPAAASRSSATALSGPSGTPRSVT
jgi:hypothetical protein